MKTKKKDTERRKWYRGIQRQSETDRCRVWERFCWKSFQELVGLTSVLKPEVRYCGAGWCLNCGVRQCLVFGHSGQVGVSAFLVKGGSVSCRVKDCTNLCWEHGNGGW